MYKYDRHFLIIFFFFASDQKQWTICFNTAVTSVFLRGNDQIWRLTLVVMGKYVGMRKRYISIYKRNDLGKRWYIVLLYGKHAWFILVYIMGQILTEQENHLKYQDSYWGVYRQIQQLPIYCIYSLMHTCYISHMSVLLCIADVNTYGELQWFSIHIEGYTYSQTT